MAVAVAMLFCLAATGYRGAAELSSYAALTGIAIVALSYGAWLTLADMTESRCWTIDEGETAGTTCATNIPTTAGTALGWAPAFSSLALVIVGPGRDSDR